MKTIQQVIANIKQHGYVCQRDSIPFTLQICMIKDGRPTRIGLSLSLSEDQYVIDAVNEPMMYVGQNPDEYLQNILPLK